jgi:O-antigen/teichoic acid export membrane protein
VILCFGEFFNTAFGAVGLVLNMAGLERFTAKGGAIAVAASAILNLTLVSFWGTVGAAIATSVTLIIWKFLLFVWLYRETGVRTLGWYV